MRHETAGDPITGVKWTRRTTAKLAAELARCDIRVSANTVGRLLKGLGFRLRVNQKQIKSGNRKPLDPQKRDQQFEHIRRQRDRFAEQGNAVISVDTKKKEVIGNFKNPGRSWQAEPIAVNDHDFHTDADGCAIPYGIYDDLHNSGYICIGTTCGTPAFAVDCVLDWWRTIGRERYRKADELLILADCGGANGYRSRAWKYRLYRQLCQPYNLKVTICHYPPGTSKWNPIEHRLFSEISKNWAGQPLRTYQTMLNYIRTTRTATGLSVRARLDTTQYMKGEKIPDAQMRTIPLSMDKHLALWNYTISPSKL